MHAHVLVLVHDTYHIANAGNERTVQPLPPPIAKVSDSIMISQVLGHSQRMAVCQYGNTTILVVATVVWEIFVVKKFRVTIFRELNFRFRGHSRKFITVHRQNLSCTNTSTAVGQVKY